MTRRFHRATRRRPCRRPLALVSALLAAAVSLQGHHSIVSVYDFGQRLPLEATVVQFEFVNPHPFLTADVKRRTMERWRLEMDNRWELAELGFAPEKLSPGDRILLIVNPARSEPQRGYVRRLERPADGFTYQHHD